MGVSLINCKYRNVDVSLFCHKNGSDDLDLFSLRIGGEIVTWVYVTSSRETTIYNCTILISDSVL